MNVMKKIMFLLMAVLMSISTSTFAGTTTAQRQQQQSSTGFSIPVNIIVKQTIEFTDGKTIDVYYQKEGNVCKLYSREDVMKYSQSDLNRIKSTNFEIVDHCEGKCLLTKNVSDVLSLAKSLFGKIR